MNLSELITKAQGIALEPGTIAGKCMFCGKENIGFEPEISGGFTNANICSGGNNVCPACHYVNHGTTPPMSDIPLWEAYQAEPTYENCCKWLKQHAITAWGVKGGKGKLFRTNMWYVTEHGIGVIRFLKKERKEGQVEARDLSSVFRMPAHTPRDILTNPPEPPFAIYLTRTWKKPGWQTMLRANGGVSVSRESFQVGLDYEVIYVDRQKLIADLAYIDMLRSDPLKPGKILLTKGELESGKIGAGGVAKMIDAGMDVAAIVGDLRRRANDPGWGLAVYVS